MKKVLIIASMLPAVVLAVVLAGCGKDHTTVSLADLLKDKAALTDELAWCGQQSGQQMIEGCRHAMAAQALQEQPQLLAVLEKPEPWPGKTHAFFVNSAMAAQARSELDSGNFAFRNKAKAIERRKALIERVAPDSLHAADEERTWCSAQAVRQGVGHGAGADWSRISPTCGVVLTGVNELMMPVI